MAVSDKFEEMESDINEHEADEDNKDFYGNKDFVDDQLFNDYDN